MRGWMKMTGVNRLCAQVSALVKERDMAVRRAVAETVLNIRNDSRHNAPRGKTGQLRLSHQAVLPVPGRTLLFEGDSGTEVFGPDVIVGAVQVLAPYAAYVECGTYKMPAKPYLGPAIDANEADHLQRLKAAMDGKI